MAHNWTPECREKYGKNRAEKIRLGLHPTKNKVQVRREQRLQERLHPVITHPTLESMFRGSDDEPEVATRRNTMKYVRLMCDVNPKLDAIAVAWDSMGASRQQRTTLEDLCKKVQLSVPEFLGLITPKAYEMGHQLAKLMVGIVQPDLVKTSIKAATNVKTGFKDRQMLLQAGGTVPTHKGIQIAVNQNNVNAGMPDFDQQTIDLADVVR